MRASCLSASPRGRKACCCWPRSRTTASTGRSSGSRSSSARPGSSWPASTPGRCCTGSASATTMVAGSGGFVLAALYLATRPTFWVFVAVQLVVGYAIGLFESVLNAYLAELPDATVLINRLHAFFGVGALVGPALAAWILGFGSWRTVWLVLALVCVPLGAGFAVLYPRARVAESTGPAPEPRTRRRLRQGRPARRSIAGAQRPAWLRDAAGLRRRRAERGQLGLQLPGPGAGADAVARRMAGQRVLARADPGPVPDQPDRDQARLERDRDDVRLPDRGPRPARPWSGWSRERRWPASRWGCSASSSARSSRPRWRSPRRWSGPGCSRPRSA